MNGIPVEALLRSPAQADAAQDRFDCFLREQRDGLVRFLLTRLPNEADAQDAAQESLVRLARYRDKEPPDSWRPLLYRIAVNVAIDQQRIATTHRAAAHVPYDRRSEEHTSELQSLMRISYAVFCLKKKK